MERIYNRIRRLLPVATNNNNQQTNKTPKIVTSRIILLDCFALVEIWSLSINNNRSTKSQSKYFNIALIKV